MEVDREVDVPPPALPPPALPPPAPPVVDAGPNSSERKEITNWLLKIHQQIGHRTLLLWVCSLHCRVLAHPL